MEEDIVTAPIVVVKYKLKTLQTFEGFLIFV